MASWRDPQPHDYDPSKRRKKAAGVGESAPERIGAKETENAGASSVDLEKAKAELDELRGKLEDSNRGIGLKQIRLNAALWVLAVGAGCAFFLGFWISDRWAREYGQTVDADKNALARAKKELEQQFADRTKILTAEKKRADDNAATIVTLTREKSVALSERDAAIKQRDAATLQKAEAEQQRDAANTKVTSAQQQLSLAIEKRADYKKRLLDAQEKINELWKAADKWGSPKNYLPPEDQKR